MIDYAGKQKEKHVLSWEERFNIAVRLAEALDYIHNQCSKPVIHRDVKTSNVLLSDELQPQVMKASLTRHQCCVAAYDFENSCQTLGCRCGDLPHRLDIRYKVTWLARLGTLRQSISCTEKSVTKSTFTPLEWFCLNSYQEEIPFRLRIQKEKRAWSCGYVFSLT